MDPVSKIGENQKKVILIVRQKLQFTEKFERMWN